MLRRPERLSSTRTGFLTYLYSVWYLLSHAGIIIKNSVEASLFCGLASPRAVSRSGRVAAVIGGDVRDLSSYRPMQSRPATLPE